jgi:hypothetical protein
VPCKATIYNAVTKLPSTGSELNENKSGNREDFDDVGTRLETSLKKSLRLLAFWFGLAKCAGQDGVKLLKL